MLKRGINCLEIRGDIMINKWLKSIIIKVAKTMAETALSLIGTNTIGITEIDWLGLFSACALSGFVTVLFNIKALPEVD